MTPRSYRMSTRAAGRDATRERIVDAVVGLHAEKGIVATRYEDVASRAGVSIGTVYRHFPSVGDMVRACGPRVMEITRPPTPAIFSGRGTLPARIPVLVQALHEFYGRASRWLEAADRERMQVPALEESVARREAAVEALVRATLGPRARDERIVAAVLAIVSFGTWRAMTARVPPGAATRLVTEILLAWLHKTR